MVFFSPLVWAVALRVVLFARVTFAFFGCLLVFLGEFDRPRAFSALDFGCNPRLFGREGGDGGLDLALDLPFFSV
jgi:hypothetical protein